ncbi:MAG: type II toxin-antitoxin system RelE/ParE family toxin [Deltaproteobacteria bacterium]|nr:type II toxin-antitoxin system RelE/ParE family toxin [Deltaproteobacteria bacterium]
MSFEILYDRNCLEKDIHRLDKPTLKRIKSTIEERLSIAPTDFGKPLRYTGENLWSLRVGDWRIIYKITENQIWILKIGHRREVYNFLLTK